MINVKLDENNAILYLHPDGPLCEEDFANAAAKADPFIEKSGLLKGVVIEAATFPGWDSFGALVAHLRFVRDHHKKIARVAIVTDSSLGNLAEVFISHFLTAEIRHFSANEIETAQSWVMENS